jgi:DegV family protein with EDD domain
MTVKIVTDTLSDITEDLANELGVTVVPLYVRFGEEIFRDRVDITSEEFYRRLVSESALPSTTQPTPHDFIQVYDKLSGETNEILVIVVSSKLSGTYQSAMQAKEIFKGKCRIEVVDSLSVAMGMGLLVIKAVNAVKDGASLDEVTQLVRRAISRTHVAYLFETLKYLAKGGRIGKASGLLGSLLSVKPILTMSEGELAPLTRVRSVSAGIDYLCSYATGFTNIEGMAVEHATTPDQADILAERLKSIYPKGRIYRAVISPVIGTYAGPSALALTILEAEKK